EAAAGGEDRAPVLIRELVGPHLLAGLHVPRLQLADVRRSLPPAHGRLRPIDAEEQLAGLVGPGLADERAAEVLVGRDIEVVRLRVVARRRPVLAAPESGTERNGGAGARLALGVVARAPGHRVDLREHLLGHERPGVDEPDAVRAALEPPEITVATRVHETFDHATVLRKVDQQRRRDLVPVPRVVPVVLVMAPDLAGVGVERDDGRRVEVVAGMHVAGPWPRVAGPPEREIELRIVVRGEPDRDAAGLPRVAFPRVVTRLARSRDRVGLPGLLAVARVEGGDVAADAELAARGPDHDLALRDERGQREVVAVLVIVDRRVPDH